MPRLLPDEELQAWNSFRTGVQDIAYTALVYKALAEEYLTLLKKFIVKSSDEYPQTLFEAATVINRNVEQALAEKEAQDE